MRWVLRMRWAVTTLQLFATLHATATAGSASAGEQQARRWRLVSAAKDAVIGVQESKPHGIGGYETGSFAKVNPAVVSPGRGGCLCVSWVSHMCTQWTVQWTVFMQRFDDVSVSSYDRAPSFAPSSPPCSLRRTQVDGKYHLFVNEVSSQPVREAGPARFRSFGL